MIPILHHYDLSPYAEKIRLAFGLKGLAWCSVSQPMVMPKPDLVALTGGYRRIPVLQIGADIFCDTNLIAAILEHLHPEPTLYPQQRHAETAIWCSWAERVFMWPTARYMTALNDDELGGAAFRADRAAMRGHGVPSHAEMMGALSHNREQCRIMLQWLENILSDGRHFLLGPDPGLADFAVYQRVWWLHALSGKAADVVAGLDRLVSWITRIQAVGHGRRSGSTAADARRLAATASSDKRLRIGSPAALPEIGRRISIGTEDHAPDAVVGVVVSSTTEAIAVHPDSEDRSIVVHFPRLGFRWQVHRS